MIAGIHHVALICSDYARARHFYTDILALPVIAETWRAERQSWKLDLGLPDGSQIELFSFPVPPARVSRPEACGLRHLAFTVDSLDAVIAHLAAHGVACEPVRVDPLTGCRFTFCADPDDLPIEWVERRPLSC